jgi:hypothetical protein
MLRESSYQLTIDSTGFDVMPDSAQVLRKGSSVCQLGVRSVNYKQGEIAFLQRATESNRAPVRERSAFEAVPVTVRVNSPMWCARQESNLHLSKISDR